MKRNAATTAIAGILASLLIAGIGRAEDKPSEPTGSGNLRYSISVSKFDNEAGWHGQWEIGTAFGELMTDALNQSKKFIVLGEKDMRQEAMGEQDLATSGRTAGGKKAPKTGQMTPAQLLVKGAVTHVQDSTTGGGAGISVFGFRVGGSTDRTEVNITVYIIDSTTGQVKASTKVVGKAGRKGVDVGYSGSVVGGDLAGFKKNNVGQACEDAVAQSVDFLTKQLDSIPWEGSVVKTGDKITINRGTREGVEVGQVFKVGKLDITTDNDTGEVLDSEMKQVGKIKVTQVKEKIAYCEAVEGQKKIEKDMTVQPAN